LNNGAAAAPHVNAAILAVCFPISRFHAKERSYLLAAIDYQSPQHKDEETEHDIESFQNSHDDECSPESHETSHTHGVTPADAPAAAGDQADARIVEAIEEPITPVTHTECLHTVITAIHRW
jgi:hypothetical protein